MTGGGKNKRVVHRSALRCYTNINDKATLLFVVPMIDPKYTPEIKARIFEEFKDKEYN